MNAVYQDLRSGNYSQSPRIVVNFKEMSVLDSISEKMKKVSTSYYPTFMAGGNYAVTDRKLKNYEKINSFRLLQENWDNNGSLSIPAGVIDKMIETLDNLKYQPEIFPSTYSSIQFEYEKPNGEYLEFELFSDRIKIFAIDRDNNEDSVTIDFDIKLINERVRSFYEK